MSTFAFGDTSLHRNVLIRLSIGAEELKFPNYQILIKTRKTYLYSPLQNIIFTVEATLYALLPQRFLRRMLE
jgi:hypothetical protein